MKLLINRKPQEFSPDVNLAQILDSLQLVTLQGMAVALNQQVIHRNQWDSTTPREGDSIILMQAVQGG